MTCSPPRAHLGGANGSAMSTGSGGGFYSRLPKIAICCHDLHPDLCRCHMKRRNLNGRRNGPQNAPEFAGQVQLLRELLQRNASCIQREPISGCTALHLAARNGEEEKCVRKSDRSDRSSKGPVSKLFS